MPKKVFKSRAIVPFKFLLPLLAGVILMVGLVVSAILASRSQETRSQAAVAAPPPSASITCRRYNGSLCQTGYFSGSCPSGYEKGACPTSAIVCPDWGPCTNGQKTCSTPGGEQGLQSRVCTDGQLQQQYCPLPSCGSSASPKPSLAPSPLIPTHKLCNTSPTSVSQNCASKRPGDPLYSYCSITVNGVFSPGHCSFIDASDTCRCVPDAPACNNSASTTSNGCVQKQKGANCQGLGGVFGTCTVEGTKPGLQNDCTCTPPRTGSIQCNGNSGTCSSVFGTSKYPGFACSILGKSGAGICAASGYATNNQVPCQCVAKTANWH